MNLTEVTVTLITVHKITSCFIYLFRERQLDIKAFISRSGDESYVSTFTTSNVCAYIYMYIYTHTHTHKHINNK